jgi:hypothetical protein
MSLERWAYLYSLLVMSLLGVYFGYASRDPIRVRGGRWLVKAFDSWFLRARWSLDVQSRLRIMALTCLALAVAALILLILDPPPRYQR